MKQLKKLKLKDFSEMTDSEMKFVVGGSGSDSSGTNCSTTCSSGVTIEIEDCIGTCTAVDGVSVKCEGKTQTLEKKCK